MRPGPRSARTLFTALLSCVAVSLASRPTGAQATMDPQRVFDTGHTVGAFYGDLRWEWMGMGPSFLSGGTAGSYPVWASQLKTLWPNAWTGVTVRSTDVVLVNNLPTRLEQVHDNIEADLRDFSCPALQPNTLAADLYHAGQMMATAFYFRGRRITCPECLREWLMRASQAVGRAARQFPGLSPIASTLAAMQVRAWRPIELQNLIMAVNDVLPNGPIDCGAPSPQPPPQPPPVPPGAFNLYNTPYDPQRAQAMGMRISANSAGGEMTGMYSMDGRCQDQVRVAWQFDADVSTIRPGQRFNVRYGFQVQGNCRPSTREYLVFEAHGFRLSRVVPPAVAVQSIGQQRLSACGVLDVMETDPLRTWAWAGGANRPTSNQQTLTADARVSADRGGCAWAMLRFKLRDRRTGREVEVIYHYER